MLAITTSVVTFAGVLAPRIMGSMIQNASTPLAGYEQGYVVLGMLLLVGGIIGLLFINPERIASDWPQTRRPAPATSARPRLTEEELMTSSLSRRPLLAALVAVPFVITTGASAQGELVNIQTLPSP